MIKVCYIIGQLTKGGAEKQLYELIKGLDKQKYTPIVISLTKGGYWIEPLLEEKIDVIQLQREKSFEFARFIQLIRILKELAPEIVHTYLFSANSYGRLAALWTRIPIIIAGERNFPALGKDKSIYKIIIDKILSRFTKKIICNSNAARMVLIKRYGIKSDKIMTIHNGININGFDHVHNIKMNSGEINVVTVGNLIYQKNYHLFLRVAQRIIDNLPIDNIKFHLIGDGPLRDDLVLYAESLQLEKKVCFWGERDDVPELLPKMTLFLMTSRFEGLSNAIMEAMLSGLPVIATDVGGTNEMVIDGSTGYLCPSDDEDQIIEKILHLIDHPDHAFLLGERGRQFIIKNFGINKMIAQTQSLYATLSASQ